MDAYLHGSGDWNSDITGFLIGCGHSYVLICEKGYEIMYTKFHTFHRLHALNLNADSSAVKL